MALIGSIGESRDAKKINALIVNAIGTKIARFNIGNVHGTATALAIAFFLAEKFGEHVFYFRTLANAVAMAAMG